jgi:hypothetical protein
LGISIEPGAREVPVAAGKRSGRAERDEHAKQQDEDD